jgi:hypothetical protein
VTEVGTSKAGGTISQQAAVHPWLAADAHGNTKHAVLHFKWALCGIYFYIGALWLNTVCRGYGTEPNTSCSLSFYVIILIPALLTNNFFLLNTLYSCCGTEHAV